MRIVPVALLLDPFETGRGTKLSLLHAGNCYLFSFVKTFSDFLLIFSLLVFWGIIICSGVDVVVIVLVPLISPCVSISIMRTHF